MCNVTTLIAPAPVGLSFISRKQAAEVSGISYIGSVNSSAKIVKGEKLGVDTFIIYLAPSTQSGYNVCPMATQDCINACLHASGHNKIDKSGTIDRARIRKTKLFFEDRNFFMAWLVAEIKAAKKAAERKGHQFAVRINGTSDISPLSFKLDGQNILEIFPDVQFYDYTKVPRRAELLSKYSNYDLTLSYSGYNWDECHKALNSGVRVAMVFERVPATYKGYTVINGDETDLRYLDPKNVIVGLKFKQVRQKIDFTAQRFVIQATDPDCQF